MTGVAGSNRIHSAEDKAAKRQLVIETISGRCKSSSNPTFQRIAWAIDSDDCKLEAEVLSGDRSCYSYKVHVNWRPELCVFAVLCFESAGDRDGNEFAITAAARELASVVVPIAIYDVDRDGLRMKLMVTEWSARATRLVDRLVNPRHPPGQALIVSSPCRDIELNVRVDADGEKQLKAGRSGVFQVSSSSKRRRVM